MPLSRLTKPNSNPAELLSLLLRMKPSQMATLAYRGALIAMVSWTLNVSHEIYDNIQAIPGLIKQSQENGRQIQEIRLENQDLRKQIQELKEILRRNKIALGCCDFENSTVHIKT